MLVGTATGDDAAVWRIGADRALVATVDFITPIVDDARTWGRIAAANSVSDVYAMGARPLFALNIVCWNAAELPTTLLTEVLAGAAEIAEDCGFVIVGGHTVDDPEPKFGLSVTGQVHPDRLLRNSGLRDGDALVLTKPLGTGVIATAVKAASAPVAAVAAMVASMCRTNADAAAIALEAGATGATDVTGFGLLGHLAQMGRASNVDSVIDTARIPLLPSARDLVEAGYLPGGSRRNLDWIRDRLDGDASDDDLALLADAQTSGGLLFGAAPDAAAGAVTELRATGHEAAVIGHASSGTGRIRIR